MSNQITGRIRISLKGKLLRSKAGAKLNLGGVQRNAVLGDSGPLGFSEETMPPSIEGVIMHTAGTDLEELKAITDENIPFETDTGVTYVLRNAWLENTVELTGGEGEVPVKFVGITAEPV